MKIVFNSKGNKIYLSNELGRGGEGSVYSIQGNSTNVAKIYTKPIEKYHVQKLTQMIGMHNEHLSEIAAWPLDILFKQPNNRQKICGILMPNIDDYKEIHCLYGPTHRKQEFPNADWSFLIYTARNIARAFKVLHANGHVIGDVNPGNVFVSKKAMVKLIDCDSFQVRNYNGSYFTCEVGVPHFTPPELQGKSFKKTLRCTNHDNFGLAVLIFHLLFMGRHPYSGKYLGREKFITIEKAIEEFRYAYGQNAQNMLMQAPPNSVSVNITGTEINNMFEKAFSIRKGVRPTPREWDIVLGGLLSELCRCDQNPGHRYSKKLYKCPWCDLEQRTGVIFFFYISPTGHTPSEFHLKQIIKEIESIQGPQNLDYHVHRNESNPLPPPTPLPKKLKREKVFKELTGISTGIIFVFCIGIFFPDFLLFGIITGFFITKGIGFVETDSIKKERHIREKKYKDAKNNYNNVLNQWHSQARYTIFNDKKAQIEQLISGYKKIFKKCDNELAEMKRNIRSLQLKQYLEKFFIDKANISGIGPIRLSTLESYGIETAADITKNKIMSIPGFGEVLSTDLVNWKKRKEKGFVFNPKQGLNPSDIAKVQGKYRKQKHSFENKLIHTPNELKSICKNIETSQATLLPIVKQKFNEFYQAKADFEESKKTFFLLTYR